MVEIPEEFKAGYEQLQREIAEIHRAAEASRPTPEEMLAGILALDWTGHHDGPDCPGCLLGGFGPAYPCRCGAGFIHAQRAVVGRGYPYTVYNVGCWHCGGYEAAPAGAGEEIESERRSS